MDHQDAYAKRPAVAITLLEEAPAIEEGFVGEDDELAGDDSADEEDGEAAAAIVGVARQAQRQGRWLPPRAAAEWKWQAASVELEWDD